jgi:hypothetical protein
MSEEFPTHESKTGYAEQLAELERQTAGEEVREISEHASAEQSPVEQAEQLNTARKEVAAVETAPAKQNLTEQQPAAQTPSFISKELRALTAARSLSTIRNRLPFADKALSKVIHQPAIRVVSNAGAKTVARPSGLFTGGLLALVGSSLYLYLASHIGFAYNYVVAGILFVAGFILGIAVEGLIALASRVKR